MPSSRGGSPELCRAQAASAPTYDFLAEQLELDGTQKQGIFAAVR
ncbi:hypothetical protein [Streptomyces sp. B6B3]